MAESLPVLFAGKMLCFWSHSQRIHIQHLLRQKKKFDPRPQMSRVCLLYDLSTDPVLPSSRKGVWYAFLTLNGQLMLYERWHRNESFYKIKNGFVQG